MNMNIQSNIKSNIAVKNIRFANTEKVMNCLVQDKSKTRNELAKANHISLMTVKHIVDDLIANNVVKETVDNNTEIGRKPKILEIVNDYGNIVCINLAGKSKISFRIYDIYENLLDEGNVLFNENEDDDYVEVLLSVIKKIKVLLKTLPSKTVGIAAFVPSAYYEEADLVNYDLIAHFKNLHLKALLKKHFNVDNILVIHDVFSAAKSEYEELNPTDESLFYFYCGTGVGGFFIHRNTPITGKDLMAGEIGKMIVGMQSGKYVTLEEIASVDVIKSGLRNLGKTFDEATSLYLKGDKNMQDFFKPILDKVSEVIYNLLWVYNPDRVVIDSCCSEYSKIITECVKVLLKNLRNEAIPINTDIRQAKYDEYHTMRGCFQMVRAEWIRGIAKINSN